MNHFHDFLEFYKKNPLQSRKVLQWILSDILENYLDFKNWTQKIGKTNFFMQEKLWFLSRVIPIICNLITEENKNKFHKNIKNLTITFIFISKDFSEWEDDFLELYWRKNKQLLYEYKYFWRNKLEEFTIVTPIPIDQEQKFDEKVIFWENYPIVQEWKKETNKKMKELRSLFVEGDENSFQIQKDLERIFYLCELAHIRSLYHQISLYEQEKNILIKQEPMLYFYESEWKLFYWESVMQFQKNTIRYWLLKYAFESELNERIFYEDVWENIEPNIWIKEKIKNGSTAITNLNIAIYKKLWIKDFFSREKEVYYRTK